MANEKITLAHGAGGKMSAALMRDVILPAFDNPVLDVLHDGAKLATSGRLAFTTDSYVVRPLFFAGGNIGKIAVCGTVNDLAMTGAVPRYLSCGLILEEGFPVEDLSRIVRTMRETADAAGVAIVTGDTKVVEHGKADGIFINTAGVGVLRDGIDLSAVNIKPGDKVLVSGTIGDHGIAIISTREELSFSTTVQSDAAPLNHLIAEVLDACPEGTVRAFRDPTRGGVASTLNEFAEASGCSIRIEEDAVPVHDQVRGACEMLGYDVFQVANEGKMICVVDPSAADAALSAMRGNKYGADAAIIGEVIVGDGHVYLRTGFGSERILDMLVGEQLPRIC